MRTHSGSWDRTTLTRLVAGLWLAGCANRDAAVDGETGSESETGTDEIILPSGDTCTLELSWQLALPAPDGLMLKSRMFEIAADGGLFVAQTDSEREVYVLHRYGADGELLWTADTGVSLRQFGGDMLELDDGNVALVTPDRSGLDGYGGHTQIFSATGELVRTEWSSGMPWEVIGPQGEQGFACAGSFAYAWSDITGMSTGIYDAQTSFLLTAWEPETSRRLTGLLGFDGRTFVIDGGCAIDELDADTRLPVPWAACADPPADWTMLERLAGGQLIAAGLRGSGEAARAHVQMYGADGERLSSWTATEGQPSTALAALSDGGVVVGSPDRLWVLDAQLELVRACTLDSVGASTVGTGLVVVDEQGQLFTYLAGSPVDGRDRVVVARVDGLLE